MPIDDKIAAARKIEAFLKTVIQNGDFRLRYRITIDPPVTDSRDWERPSILVDLSGSDSRLCWHTMANCCGRLSCWRWSRST